MPSPLALLGLYAFMSALAFLSYGKDKAAAERGERRTPENTLHALALFGGWPGALAGQRVFHHKTKKTSFQVVFWCTVFINCLALAWFVSR
jgi:uncharacterized membrane protein YsdA (DUF1294 family)